MNCRACGRDHPGWVTCKKAAFDALDKAQDKPEVVNRPVSLATNQAQSIGTVEKAHQKVANRHGKYADPDRRKSYKREYMAKRRAGAKVA